MSTPVIGQVFNDGRSWDGTQWVARWEPAATGGNYISVADYGAVGDNIADDGPAIQAAIDANPGRTIFLPKPPSGYYRITAPLTIKSAGTYLLGENRTQTRILNAGAGDAVVFAPNDPGVDAQQGGNGLLSLTITRSSHQAAGVGLKVQKCSRIFVFDCAVTEHYINLYILGCNSCRFNNIAIGGGVYFTGSPGSAGIKLSPQPLNTGGIEKCQITQFDQFTVGGGPDIWDQNLLIESTDSAYFSNGYISGTESLFKIKAGTVANSSVTGLIISNVYFDGIANGTTRVGMRIESDLSAASTPTIIEVSGCLFGQLGQGIVSDEPGLGRLTIGANTNFFNIMDEAIKVSGAAADIQVSGCQFYACGRNSNKAYIDIDAATTVQISSNLANAISFPTNTFVKLAGTIANAVLGPNITHAFTTDQDLSTATVTELNGSGVRGIFTPTLSFDTPGDSSFATTITTARWELIGTIFHCHVELAFTPTIGSGTGALRIGGLPFAAPNIPNISGGSIGTISSAFTWPAGVTMLTVEQTPNTAYTRVLGNGSAIARVAIGAAHMTTGVAHTLNFQFYTNMKI